VKRVKLDWIGTPQLTQILHRAAGTWAREAALELLTCHDYWLRRRDLMTAALITDDEGWPTGINWTAAADFARTAQGSSSELAILYAACSIAGRQPAGLDESSGEAQRWTIEGLFNPLGQVNRELLLGAIRHSISGAATGAVPLANPGHPTAENTVAAALGRARAELLANSTLVTPDLLATPDTTADLLAQLDADIAVEDEVCDDNCNCPKREPDRDPVDDMTPPDEPIGNLS
jgi:hypothetical protein